MQNTAIISNTDNCHQNIDLDNPISVSVAKMSGIKFVVANNFKATSEQEVKQAVVRNIIRLLVEECQRGGASHAD